MINVENGISAFQKIFTPVRYLRISHDEKRIFDFSLPLFISIIILILIIIFRNQVIIFGTEGLLYTSTELLKILIGFFIAALAAVATFPNPEMDENMDGDPPKLDDKELTRRRFLAYLFGYLSFASFFTYLLGSVANNIAPEFKIYLPENIVPFMKYIFLELYLLVFINIISTTLLGLYYLTERIHQTKPVLKKPKEGQE